MSGTYDRGAEAEADRAQQKLLIIALNAWDRALRRDECGAWHIQGKFGTIHTFGDGESWILYIGCRSARHWSATKTRLSFCASILDCESEGCLQLQQLPNSAQATLIRNALGIRKRTEFAPNELERRRAAMARILQAEGLANSASQSLSPGAERLSVLEAEPAK